jgi:hypothetical protein
MMPSIYVSPAAKEAFRLDSSGNLGIGTASPQNGMTIMNNGAATFNTTVTAPGGVITNVDKVTLVDLDSEAFKTPIDTLINLWVTRYGNEWVDLDKIMEDAFFSSAYKRLKSLGQLETHYLTDRARFVCRKPT